MNDYFEQSPKKPASMFEELDKSIAVVEELDKSIAVVNGEIIATQERIARGGLGRFLGKIHLIKILSDANKSGLIVSRDGDGNPAIIGRIFRDIDSINE